MLQRQQGVLKQNDLYSADAYLPRHMHNIFTQPDGSHPVPPGGMLDWMQSNYHSNNARLLVSFNQTTANNLFNIAAIAGFDMRDLHRDTSTGRYYGFRNDRSANIGIDYRTLFPQYRSIAAASRIPANDYAVMTTDRYLSFYANAAGTLLKRYTVTVSGRIDKSNLFGSVPLKKALPLWSAGALWQISQEPYYQSGAIQSVIPYMKLRATMGYSGNTDRLATDYATVATGQLNSYGAVPIVLQSLVNENLKWEKVKMINFGIDLQTNWNIDLTFDYYTRRSKDLLGMTPGNVTSGGGIFLTNSAAMKGSGFELSLSTRYKTGKLNCLTTLLVNSTKNKITSYGYSPGEAWVYTDAHFLSPREGRPLYFVAGLPWGGLDASNGDPLGYLNGQKSNNYTAINAQNADSLTYIGPGSPVYFGSIRQAFQFGPLNFSFIIGGKFGYYFRKNALNYGALFSYSLPGSESFGKRWQKPGDELTTSVYSMRYPNPTGRDLFYGAATIHAEKADHIRLQDVRIAWNITPAWQCYAFSTNLGILWKATSTKTDPDFLLEAPAARSITFGMKLNF